MTRLAWCSSFSSRAYVGSDAKDFLHHAPFPAPPEAHLSVSLIVDVKDKGEEGGAVGRCGLRPYPGRPRVSTSHLGAGEEIGAQLHVWRTRVTGRHTPLLL